MYLSHQNIYQGGFCVDSWVNRLYEEIPKWYVVLMVNITIFINEFKNKIALS